MDGGIVASKPTMSLLDSALSARVADKPDVNGDNLNDQSIEKAGVRDCLSKCVYSHVMSMTCSTPDWASPCKAIDLIRHEGGQHECCVACGDKVAKEELTDVVHRMCRAEEMHSASNAVSEQVDLRKRELLTRVYTTKVTTIGWGQVPFSLTTNNILSIGVPNTIALVTVLDSTTLPYGKPGFTSTVSDRLQPLVTILVGLPAQRRPASMTSRQAEDSIQELPSRETTSSSSSPQATFSVPVTSLDHGQTLLTSSTATSSATQSAVTTPSDASTRGGLSHGLVIGLAVGIPLALLTAVISLIIWTMRRKKYNRSLPTMTPTDSYTDYNQSTAESKSPSVHESHAEAVGTPVIELDAHLPQQEVGGNPPYELGSTYIPAPIVPTLSPASPAPGSAYVPYRRPDDDQVLSTHFTDTSILAAETIAETDAGRDRPEVPAEITVAK